MKQSVSLLPGGGEREEQWNQLEADTAAEPTVLAAALYDQPVCLTHVSPLSVRLSD